jgi:hypothetical protein
MKKITCEMCGGNDLLKDEGFLVCQSCGTKYTVEEARKLMVEFDGPIEVKGKVAIDNTARLDNLYKIARRARDDGNTDQAYRKYEELLTEDPDNWEPNFFTAFYSGIGSFNNDNKGGSANKSGNRWTISFEYRSGISACLRKIYNCVDSVYSLIINIEDINEQKAAADTVEKNVKKAAQYLLDVVDDEHARMKQEIDHFVTETNEENDIFGKMADKKKHGYTNDNNRDVYKQEITKMTAFLQYKKRHLDDIIANRRKAAAEAEAKRNFDEFWETHREEKTALESEKESLLERISAKNEEISTITKKTDGYDEMPNLEKRLEALKAEINTIDSDAEIVERNQKIEQLNAEKKALGFLNHKEKKAIDGQITAVQSEIASIKESKITAIQTKIEAANVGINQIQARIDQNTQAAKAEITVHEARIKAIDWELTKPRSESGDERQNNGLSSFIDKNSTEKELIEIAEMIAVKEKQVENLIAEKNAIDSSAEIVGRNQKIEQLLAEHKKLGNFNSDRKNQINAQITSLKREIYSILDSKLPIQEKIDSLHKEIKQLKESAKIEPVKYKENSEEHDELYRLISESTTEEELMEFAELINNIEDGEDKDDLLAECDKKLQQIKEQRQLWEKQGLCVFCGGEVEGFWKICQSCGEKNYQK